MFKTNLKKVEIDVSVKFHISFKMTSFIVFMFMLFAIIKVATASMETEACEDFGYCQVSTPEEKSVMILAVVVLGGIFMEGMRVAGML